MDSIIVILVIVVNILRAIVVYGSIQKNVKKDEKVVFSISNDFQKFQKISKWK